MFERKRRHFWFGEEWESPRVTLEVDKSSATFGAHFNFGGEKDFAVGLSAFGRSIWLSLHDAIPQTIRQRFSDEAKRKADQLNAAAGRTVAYSYQLNPFNGRNTGISILRKDDFINVNIWSDDDNQRGFHWSTFPKARLAEALLGKSVCETKTLEDYPAPATGQKARLPEGPYDVSAKIIEQTNTWSRVRALGLDGVIRRSSKYIELECAEGLPIPGKGENSWDCDDDAIYSSTYDFDACDGSVYNAIGKLEMDVMRKRRRHASLAWVPGKARAGSEEHEDSVNEEANGEPAYLGDGKYTDVRSEYQLSLYRQMLPIVLADSGFSEEDRINALKNPYAYVPATHHAVLSMTAQMTNRRGMFAKDVRAISMKWDGAGPLILEEE